MDKKERILELVSRLNQASENYYNDLPEIMTNYEWDALYAELERLEEETGFVEPDSPTRTTGRLESMANGTKEAHEFPALSLAKTKQVADLRKWAGRRPVWVSPKCDGATLVATYDTAPSGKGARLTRILTRGDGTVGTNITFMA